MTDRAFNRILVANRGEIAIRVFQACTDLGIETVAIYSREDLLAPHRYRADESYLVGAELTPVGAYLDIDGIIKLAVDKQIDAIHPGYGFLSENAAFARRCAEAGITFIGPSPEQLEMFGDKVEARQLAIAAGIPVPQGTEDPIQTDEEAQAFADVHGYPLIVKAVLGGGGRGMRVVRNDDELIAALAAGRREAEAAFGDPSVYLEQFIENARHIEVQILGDQTGNVIHLWERDCSVQRRHQKVVEVAPATLVDPQTRHDLRDAAVQLMKQAGYSNAGTVEFLVGGDNRFYFLEVNPRIQVEHTVTEMVTGVDLVQSQIQIAAGATLEDLQLDDLPEPRGCAIQCRVTTEDPLNGFLPDTGRILTFRSASGNGVRLDIGSGFTGAEIQPHYDSLLVKLSAWDRDRSSTIRRLIRALRELRVRGVRTNLPYLVNVLQHPDFIEGRATTTFIDTHPELLSFPPIRDRGTKLLHYIADTSVNNPKVMDGRIVPAASQLAPVPPVDPDWSLPAPTPKTILDTEGPVALANWITDQQRLLMTDTTMRDAHQSLLATRMRTYDLLQIAEVTGQRCPNLFSLENWGGATFDTSYRFLKEDPWQRLTELRERIPHILFQMLLRGQSLVGYGSYPDNLVRAFVRETATAGIDVFRIFDSLNYLPNMEIAIDAVREVNKIAEVSLCYTGDLLERDRVRYDLDYYVELATSIESAGAHILAIKDMAGILKPEAAYELVSALKETVSIPIHLHTHDSAGTGVATVVRAAEAGLDIADGALSSMAGGTSQPSLNSIVASLSGTDRDTGLDLVSLQELSNYWSVVRGMYSGFEAGPIAPDTSVYQHQIPGGQFTNLRQQAEAVGLGSRWNEVIVAYRQADQALGELIKVTPSSKAVGDFALFMVQNELTPENLVARIQQLDAPQSVVEMLSGGLGQPPYGFPVDLQRAVLKGRKPISVRPGSLLKDADLQAKADDLRQDLKRPVSNQEVLSSLIYPEVFAAYQEHVEAYSDTSCLETRTFYNGLQPGETTYAEIEEGKTLIMSLTAIGPVNEEGERTVYFEFNGSPREISAIDRSVTPATIARPKANLNDWRQVAAPMPGKIARVLPAAGEFVKQGDQLLVIEAMKMETVITAPRDARVVESLVRAGDDVNSNDLLMELAEE